MSFRSRLLIAFGLLASLQAVFFTLLSDQLLRDGLEGEANARLALIGSLFKQRAGAAGWPPKSLQGPAAPRLGAALSDFAQEHQLSSATLLLEGASLDSGDAGQRRGTAEEWWLGDGLARPQAHGAVQVSGPLFKADDGWRKTLYLKLDPERELWLRLEAGTPFLGQVSTLQRRMRHLALALGLPSLLLGLGLGYALSRRARALSLRLETGGDVRLEGHDEFASISQAVSRLLERLEAERQAKLRQARDLAMGVAHELRNPLAGISLTVDLLERKRAAGAPAEELSALSARLQEETARLDLTVARFLDFARTPQLQSGQVDLAQAAISAGQGLRPRPDVEGRATASADPQALAVVCGVLLGNAAEAAGAEGWVKVRVLSQSGKACLQVSDSGPALPEKASERLFSPFFSTKPKGLGLGLATAASLADAMGGSLRLLDDRKTFELSLPA